MVSQRDLERDYIDALASGEFDNPKKSWRENLFLLFIVRGLVLALVIMLSLWTFALLWK